MQDRSASGAAAASSAPPPSRRISASMRLVWLGLMQAEPQMVWANACLEFWAPHRDEENKRDRVVGLARRREFDDAQQVWKMNADWEQVPAMELPAAMSIKDQFTGGRVAPPADVVLHYDPKRFCEDREISNVGFPPGRDVHVYDFDGNFGSPAKPGTPLARDQPSRRIELSNGALGKEASDETVVFVAQLYVEVHVNPLISRKWQVGGRVVVQAKHLKPGSTVALPLAMRSLFRFAGQEHTMGYLVLSTHDDSLDAPAARVGLGDVIRNILMPANRREVDTILGIALKHKRVPAWARGKTIPARMRSTMINPAAWYADGVLSPVPKPDDATDSVQFGMSAQSLFVYDPKVCLATPRFYLQNLEQCLALHGTTRERFFQLFELLKTRPPHVALDPKLRDELGRMEADCVRTLTMFSTTRPYATDVHMFFDTKSPEGIAEATRRRQVFKMTQADFTTPFLPGDCDDGNATMYQLAMNLVFYDFSQETKHMLPEHLKMFQALRAVIVLIGVPCGIYGKSANPFTNEEGGGHAFGMLSPLLRFTRALFPDDGDDVHLAQAYRWFHDEFGFTYPGDRARAMVLESTMYATPRYVEHTVCPGAVRDAYALMREWMQEKNLHGWMWGNITSTVHMGTRHQTHDGTEYTRRAHRHALRVFTTAHWFIHDNDEDHLNNCGSFLIGLPDSRELGVDYHVLFESHDPFVLYPTHPQTEDEFAADVRVMWAVRRPFLRLEPITLSADRFNNQRDGQHPKVLEFLSKAEKVAYAPRNHLTMFVYALGAGGPRTKVYDDDEEIRSVQEMEELRQRLMDAHLSEGKYAVMQFGFCLAVVFFLNQ